MPWAYASRGICSRELPRASKIPEAPRGLRRAFDSERVYSSDKRCSPRGAAPSFSDPPHVVAHSLFIPTCHPGRLFLLLSLQDITAQPLLPLRRMSKAPHSRVRVQKTRRTQNIPDLKMRRS